MRSVKLKQFFDSDFREFSTYDTQRSIPSLCDGLKISQRKAIYGILKKGCNSAEKEEKVAQIAAYVAAETDYHHGEGSMEAAIIGMAQNYAGSNNVNLLFPDGQFGSRLTPEAAASRYIFTYLTPEFRKMFRPEDDLILESLLSDGQPVEPRYYIPVIPMVLVNGAQGIGTGYATKICGYNPITIRDAIIAALTGKVAQPLVPWFRGFKGKISKNEAQTVFEGVYEIVNTTRMRITELPIGYYLDDYKAVLNKLIDQGLVKNFDDNSNEESFDFVVNVPRTTTALTHAEILQKFKLISRDTENFTVWDEKGYIKVFQTADQLLAHFVAWRLVQYEKRRTAQLAKIADELEFLHEKMRFIELYVKSSQVFAHKNKKDLIELLIKDKFADPHRLLSLSIYTLTGEEIEKLKKQIAALKEHAIALQKSTPAQIYLKELKEL